ncbi:MAG TPA: hypothetical protein VG733_13485, partial [Chthoniobacteraceae bacterium]|nr:hypothetical protein [Chthoniobacteraceae bacterium]
NPDKPLLSIFAPEPMKSASPDAPHVTFDRKHPLLTVFGVRGLVLARDKKSVMIFLNAHDTRAFASITHKYNAAVIFVLGGDDIIEAIHITAPIENGDIEFRHPTSAAFAEYLRRRFVLAEFKPGAPHPTQ